MGSISTYFFLECYQGGLDDIHVTMRVVLYLFFYYFLRLFENWIYYNSAKKRIECFLKENNSTLVLLIGNQSAIVHGPNLFLRFESRIEIESVG